MKMFILGGLMFGSLIIAAVMLLLVSLSLIPVAMAITIMLAIMAVGAYSADAIASWESGQ